MLHRFPRLTRDVEFQSYLEHLCQNCPLMNRRVKKNTLPVSYVAGVKLKLIIISQQSLLDVTEIHGLPVDEDEPHTALKGGSRVLTVRHGAAWMENTHHDTFNLPAWLR